MGLKRRLETDRQILEYLRTTNAAKLRDEVMELTDRNNSVRVWIEGLLDISHEKKQ